MSDGPDTPQDAPNADAAPEAPAEQPAPVEETVEVGKPEITYDDFCKLDLRVATIVEVAEHPNADKLLVLQVDLGGERRQILAGIKAHYSPEALLGRQIVVVTNLAPRKMRGLESKGMLLAASVGDDEDVVIVSPAKEVPPGSGVS